MRKTTDNRSFLQPGIAIALALFLTGAAAEAQQQSPELAQMREVLDRQQSLIESQSEAIELQRARIEEQARQIDQQRELLLQVQTRLDELSMAKEGLQPTGEEIAARERLAQVEEVVDKPPDAPKDVLTAGEFPGSIRIPGTNLAGQVGGFVRLGVVDSFDPIGSSDRFVVGSIPAAGTASGEEARRMAISAKRSRLNLDMRMDSSFGQFRAYIEGDFAGDGATDNYRLRHAYGQYEELLVGQTWSTLVDRRAVPEQLDFEGLNALINSRQALARWSGSTGSGMRWAVGIEDPAPQLTGGQGVSLIPDLIARASRDRRWGHLRGGILLRGLLGEPDGPGERVREAAWGVTMSGAVRARWNPRNRFRFQLNYGDGIGRYINDLASVGGQDAVFDPEGRLHPLPAFAGYVSYQHFWKSDLLGLSLLRNLRSTFVYGLVNVENFDFQEPGAYDRTDRASFNLIWSPISSIDLGFEYLLGRRRNKDRSRGQAQQLQAVATFRF